MSNAIARCEAGSYINFNSGYPSHFIKKSGPEWPIRESKMFSISYSQEAAL